LKKLTERISATEKARQEPSNTLNTYMCTQTIIIIDPDDRQATCIFIFQTAMFIIN